ncbi:ATP-grasp domain-containing protein [Streptomyces sp. NPDC002004]
MQRTGILLVDVAGPDAAAVIEAASRLSLDVHAVAQRGTWDALDGSRRSLVSSHTSTDFAAHDTALERIVEMAEGAAVAGITTVNEFLTPLVAQASMRLGLPGFSDDAAVRGARNKLEMAHRFATHGVAAPRTFAVRSEEEILDLCRGGDVRFPFVVKPADGAGSVGVTVVSVPEQIGEAYLSAGAHRVNVPYGLPVDDRTVVQSYVDGIEYSVESVVQAGRIHHVCLAEKVTTVGSARVDLGFCVPARIDTASRDLMLKEVSRAIRAIGIVDGVTHTEAKIAQGRCVVIEIGARMAGGHIGTLVEAALGVDLWRACVDTSTSRPVSVRPVRERYAALRFITSPHEGRFVGVTGLPVAEGDVLAAHVRRRPGDRVAGPDSSKGRIGHVIVAADDAETANARVDELVRHVQVQVEVEAPAPSA